MIKNKDNVNITVTIFMILSMETFKEILVSGDVDDPGKLPIIFLKDVPYCDLESLIQYIYNGKVVLTESQSLASFTQLARTMGISGKLFTVQPKECGPLII